MLVSSQTKISRTSIICMESDSSSYDNDGEVLDAISEIELMVPNFQKDTITSWT